MKQLRLYLFILLAVILAAILITSSLMFQKTIISNKPILSFGNQANQARDSSGFIKVGDWIYGIYEIEVDNDIDDNYGVIIRFPIDAPNERELIYEFGPDYVYEVSVLGEWVYFIFVGGHDWEIRRLYKIKIDGSEKTELAKNVLTYRLTEDGIFYERRNIFGMRCIYAMDQGGQHSRRLGGYGLVGIENGWLYYTNFPMEESSLYGYDIYRMRLDGSDKQSVSENKVKDFIIEGNVLVSIIFSEEHVWKIQLWNSEKNEAKRQ